MLSFKTIADLKLYLEVIFDTFALNKGFQVIYSAPVAG